MQPSLAVAPPFVVFYRHRFRIEQPAALRFTYSADERAQLFLNGEWLTDGPERGTPKHWYYAEYTGPLLHPGDYCLVARVLCFGSELTAHAQTSIRHGFHLRDDCRLLDGKWEWQVAKGFQYRKPYPDWGVFPRFDAQNHNWDALDGQRGTWQEVAYVEDDRQLYPPDLPAMRRVPETNYTMRQEGNRIRVTFHDYVCVWPEFVFSGAGTVSWHWGETTYDQPEINPHNLKGNKGRRQGPYLISQGNSLTLPGGRICRWVDYWWQAGTCLDITCEGTTLENVTFHQTGYPYQREWQADSSSPELNRALEMAYRTLQACSHETYMDCPYYEQLMYIGDARLEALSTYVTTTEIRLVEKALRRLLDSQQPDGMIFSRYPARVDQVIPSFSMIYLMMLHDFALWQDRPRTVTELLPAARRIVAYLVDHIRDGLLFLPGWNFIDWVPEWQHGEPPGQAEEGTNSVLNYFAVLALRGMGELEDHFGDPEHAQANAALAEQLETTIWKRYFDQGRGLIANDLAHKTFSEHAQVLALNSKSYPQLVESLQKETNLPKAGIYFSYYYLEACWRHGLSELFFNRLDLWLSLEKLGLKTLPEEFVNPRSDCHAWSSHILYHYFASVLGIRPSRFGGRDIQVRPMTGSLAWARGKSPVTASGRPTAVPTP